MVYISDDVMSDVDLMLKHSKILHTIDLSEIHDCKKCRGKIVSISVDYVGVERCGYCNQVVDYKGFLRRKLKEFETNPLEKLKQGGKQNAKKSR